MISWPKSKNRQVGVGLNIAQNHSSSPRQSYLVIICPNSHEKLTSKIRSSWESVRTLLWITRLANRKSYLVIIWPNSHEKLTKSETRRLCVLANTKLYHRNLLLWISMTFWILVSTTLGLFFKRSTYSPPIHIQSWPKSKLNPLGVKNITI